MKWVSGKDIPVLYFTHNNHIQYSICFVLLQEGSRMLMGLDQGPNSTIVVALRFELTNKALIIESTLS